ncbi:hypothetical protein ACLMJK_001914 [Lecanora helva]
MAVHDISTTQAYALFDILTHNEAYAEIQGLKESESIAKFGPPLQPDHPRNSSSPLIQILLKKFILVLPGLRDVSAEFWTENITGLVTALDNATLSESYDKGSVGIRKTVSAAISSMIEYVSRGSLGGYPRHDGNKEHQYDISNPDDVIAAWDEFLQQIIYGDLLDRMFLKASQTDRLSDHESLVQAAHEYAVVMGQSILPLLVKAHNLAPYFLMRQTLRVGNAASMLNAMVKLILAKLNLSTVTTWFGGQGSDSGMNLLQQIVSQVLGGDIGELKKRAKGIEHSKEAPSKDHLSVLRGFGTAGTEEQLSIRSFSGTLTMITAINKLLTGLLEAEPESIALAILSSKPDLSDLDETQQKLALEYLAIELAIRDREELIKVLCHSSPDLLTSSIRAIIPAYDPIIRALHHAVDLSAGTSDLEAFLNDLIKVSTLERTSKDDSARSPSVEDYCRLIQRHQGSSHRFIHQALKNGKDLSQWYHAYGAHAAKQYRQDSNVEVKPDSSGIAAAGDFTQRLNNLMSSLTEEDQAKVLKESDLHSKYLASLRESSANSMRTIIENLSRDKSETRKGPGIFLSRWQSLMDETRITPAIAKGPVRSGKSESVRHATTTDVDGESKGDASKIRQVDDKTADPPDVSNTINLLALKFKDLLREVSQGQGEQDTNP